MQTVISEEKPVKLNKGEEWKEREKRGVEERGEGERRKEEGERR